MIVTTAQADEIEDLFWQSTNCQDVDEVNLYLQTYPNGKYENEALECLAAIGRSEVECIITIKHGLVRLMEKPDNFGVAIKSLDPGDYVVLDQQRVDTGVSEQSWYRIDSEGRTGWIRNDPWGIEKSTGECP